MWFIGAEVEQETSAPPPKKNPGSACLYYLGRTLNVHQPFIVSVALLIINIHRSLAMK